MLGGRNPAKFDILQLQSNLYLLYVCTNPLCEGTNLSDKETDTVPTEKPYFESGHSSETQNCPPAMPLLIAYTQGVTCCIFCWQKKVQLSAQPIKLRNVSDHVPYHLSVFLQQSKHLGTALIRKII